MFFFFVFFRFYSFLGPYGPNKALKSLIRPFKGNIRGYFKAAAPEILPEVLSVRTVFSNLNEAMDGEVLGWVSASQAEWESLDGLTKEICTSRRVSLCIPQIKKWRVARGYDAPATLTTESRNTQNKNPPLSTDGAVDCSDEWEVFAEPLDTCLKTIRGKFPAIHKQVLEEERLRTGVSSMRGLAPVRRAELEEELVQFVLASGRNSLKSEKAISSWGRQVKKIESHVREGIYQMFDFAEMMKSDVESDAVAAPGRFRVKGVTQRGMAVSRKR